MKSVLVSAVAVVIVWSWELFEPFETDLFPAVFAYPALFGENHARSSVIDIECPFFSLIPHEHDLGSRKAVFQGTRFVCFYGTGEWNFLHVGTFKQNRSFFL